MKRKLQLKQKIMIGAGAGLLGATAIATPLAITLSRTHTDVLDDLDAKYGIDRTVYNNMKGDLTNKYRANLEREQDKDIDAKMAKLASSLSTLDNGVQQYEQQHMANVYMAATSALMNTAKNDFEVDLVRNSRANWNEIDEMFDGMSQSFETYMSNHSFDRQDIDRVLTNAANLKVNLVNQLKTEYANDTLGGVLKAKTQLLSCFDAINTEIARLAAETRLVDFMSNYRFEYVERISEDAPYTANRFNVMKGAFTKGEPISDANMNKIFQCYNVTTREPVDFVADGIIPGYRLIPVFAGTIENPITNEYSIQIDWRAVSQNFAESEDAEKATAHLIDVDQQLIDDVTTNKDKINSIDDFFNRANEKIRLTEYKMLVTSDFESQQLAETYFDASANGANIEFVWEDKFNPCYDGFMYLDQSSTEEQTLNLRQLAMTNIAIKAKGCAPRLLKEVIATVEQENYEPKDMVENFVKNCDITDTVKIIRSGDKITSVTNNFTANYSNQVRWDAHGQESIGATSFGTTMHAENLEISEVFFEQANEEFNMQYRDSYLLLNNDYKRLALLGQVSTTLSILAIGIHVAAQICYLCQIIVEFKTGEILFGLMNIVLFAVTGYLLYLEIKKEVLYHKDYLDPILDYKDNANKFRAEKPVINKVKKELTSDLKYYVLIDDDNPYDPQTYNEKLRQFRDLPKEVQQELFTKYHFFKTDFAVDLFSLAKQYKVDPRKFKEDFSDWKNPSGKCSVESGILALLTSIEVGFLTGLAMKVHEDEEAAAQAEASEASHYAADEVNVAGQKYL